MTTLREANLKRFSECEFYSDIWSSDRMGEVWAWCQARAKDGQKAMMRHLLSAEDEITASIAERRDDDFWEEDLHNYLDQVMR